MELLSVAKRYGRKGFHLRDLVRRERKATMRPNVSRLELARWWRRGFLGESVVLLGLTEENWPLYVTDVERGLRTPFINGTYNPTLNDKLVFYHTMVSLSAPTPTVYGMVIHDRIAWIHPPEGAARDGVRGLLEQGRELVLKPYDGGLGERIWFVSLQEGTLLANGAPVDEHGLERLLAPGTLITERVHQGRYAAEIYPQATNTLRILTMWDYQRGEPFVAAAEQRLGNHRSAPVDNWSRGGLVSGIDVATGTMRAALGQHEGRLVSSSHHPDSGAPIEGVTVSNWSSLLEGILDVSRKIAHVPYVGWDVVAGDDRYFLIEGNSYPDTQMQCVTGPLLADPSVRRFYTHHGVLSAPRPRPAPEEAAFGVEAVEASRGTVADPSATSRGDLWARKPFPSARRARPVAPKSRFAAGPRR